MSKCNAQQLLQDGSCFLCLDAGIRQVLELQLLCEILNNGIGGGGSGVQAANLFFAGPSSGAAAAPTFRAMVNADLGTTLTPQFARVGIGQAADANIPLVSTRPSGGAGVNVVTALLDVTTSNPQLVLGAASNQAGLALTYDRGTGRALLSMFGVGGLAIDNSGNASFTGGTLTVATSNMIVTAGVYSCQGNSGLTTTFDGTNTVTVTGGLITGVA